MKHFEQKQKEIIETVLFTVMLRIKTLRYLKKNLNYKYCLNQNLYLRY